MSEGESEQVTQPIIIKRVRKAEHGHHGGAWKVAYADMVTALMALFIVLWILGQSEEVIAHVSGYFSDPAGFLSEAASNSLEGGSKSSQLSIEQDSPPPTPPPQSEEPDPSPTLQPGSGEGEHRRWREAAEAIRDALEGTPNYAKFRDQIELSITPEGLRISLVEAPNTRLFKTGDVELNNDAAALFQVLGDQLSRLPNRVAIEGHTDSTAFNTQSRLTNWELSTGRAHTARRALTEGGLHQARLLEVRGYADRYPYNPLDPGDSRNRRVSITLLSEDAVRAREDLAREKLLR